MGNQLQKLNCKHHHDDGDAHEREQKRQNDNHIDATANSSMELKAITNICYDCLERILDFLDLKSLLNLACTCRRLQIAAAAKFGDEFGKKCIELDLHNPHVPWIYMHRDGINVSGVKILFPFLRCFGAKISNLIINYSNDDDITASVDQYVNQYCADTLVNISQINRASTIVNYQKPFKNVRKIAISSSHLGRNLPKFVYLYPNLRHLKMYYVSIDKTALKNVSFPNLVHLALIVSENSDRRQQFTFKKAAKILHANRQLQNLNLMLYGKMTMSTLLHAISGNPFITRLFVMMGPGYSDSFVNVSMIGMNRFIAKHPMVMELDLLGFRFTADDSLRFIRQLTSLKLFKFQVKDHHERNRLLAQLDNEWKCDSWTFYIKLERRKMNKSET